MTQTPSNLYTNAAPLAATVASLRQGQHSFSLYLDQIAARIDTYDAHVQALLPEPDRMARLRRELAALRERFPTLPHGRRFLARWSASKTSFMSMAL